MTTTGPAPKSRSVAARLTGFACHSGNRRNTSSPVARSAAEQIESLRQQSSGKYFERVTPGRLPVQRERDNAEGASVPGTRTVTTATEREGIMSKFSETATTVHSQAYLVAALSDLGYKAEIHADGAALVGYEGRERPERAHVIIRRVQIGPASNDIGFVRKPDGTFGAVLSEYDPRDRLRREVGGPGSTGLQGTTRRWRTRRPRDTYSVGASSYKRPKVRRSGSSFTARVNDATETDYRHAGTGWNQQNRSEGFHR